MKTLILIFNFSFLIFNYSPAQQYGWVDISANVPGPVAFHDLSDLFFINDNVGWITSSSHNMVYHTTDGGMTFTTQTTTLPTNAIHMLSATEGYCGGQSGFVYRTTDGGLTWNYHGTITTTLNDIAFPPTGTTGYACGFNGKIYSITSTGLTVMTTGINGDLSALSFPVNSSEGWVCGLGGVVRHFTGGVWAADQKNITGSWSAIHFIDNQIGWMAGDYGAIKHTSNGQNWTEQTNPDPMKRTLIDVFFLNVNLGWAVGLGGRVHQTTNGGANWTVEENGLTSSMLRGVQFTSPTNGYIVGNNKTLLKYTLLTSASESPETGQVQVYPNPITGNFKVESLKLKVHRVEVLDLNGKVLERFSLDTAFSSQEFDIGHLKPGIYLLRLWGNNQSITNKIIKYDK